MSLGQVPIGRRLMRALPAWERIGASDLVLRGVQPEWTDGREPEELGHRAWAPPFWGPPEQRRAYEAELATELREDIIERTTREEAK
jgi:hypothetical protein